MPPTEEVPFKPPSRRFSIAHIAMPVYLGLDVELAEDNSISHYAISVHDGSYTTDFYSGTLCKHTEGMSQKDCLIEALLELRRVVALFAKAQHYKVQLIACSYRISRQYAECTGKPEHSATSSFWRELDAIPFRVETHGDTPDERASAAVRKAVMWMSPQYPGNLPRISVGYRHEVEVDFNGMIHMCDLVDYKSTVCEETWRVWQEIVHDFKGRQLRVSYFNSTPQGGGVALMRHGLLRFLNLNGAKVHWYVARPKPEIFDITKRKFHNVLQGVASPEVRLTEEDKQAFIDWSDENVHRFWNSDRGGPINNSDVVVVDDPQVVGVIPHIKKFAPHTRIIFRSHIEMRADLIRDDPNGPQAETWNFLWGFIKHADLFVAHPVENFIPDVVPRRNCVLLPACTDPLDGLNKEMPTCIDYYRSVFNRISVDQGANEVDWHRPYIVQVARFDPSKGINDVLESYRLLRLKMDAKGHRALELPQLVICGQGSVDDPDGTLIYEQTHERIGSSTFSDIIDDIIVTRLPASDQLLNMILRGARVALQLSHREGFEVKVTEAMQKGVPVIAYKAGGIPLQIIPNVTGFLLPVGDVDGVADRLYELIMDNKLHQNMSMAARGNLTEEYFTVWNAMSWLHLFNELTNHASLTNGLLDEQATFQRNSGVGNARKVCEFWKEQYAYNPPPKPMSNK